MDNVIQSITDPNGKIIMNANDNDIDGGEWEEWFRLTPQHAGRKP